ncbi:MAG: ATP-dependent helicase, partial [candidate division WOR-3 bacterium]
VAITRARDHLYIVFPLRYYFKRYSAGDGHSYAQLTRFVTPEMLPMFDVRTLDPYGSDMPAEISTEVDFRERIRSGWQAREPS